MEAVKMKLDKYKLDKYMYEFYGILMGDGCISRYTLKYRSNPCYEIRIDGSSFTDVEYYYNHLVNLLSKVAKKVPKPYLRKQCNGICIHFRNKEFALFLNEKFDFPFGKKRNIKIKEEVLLNFDNLKHVIRGLFDTDGSLYFTKNNSEERYYPIIEITTYSSNLLNQLKTALISEGFIVKINHRKDSIKLHGKKNLLKWMEIIGTSHIDKASKFIFWKKYGHCPKIDELPYKERLKILGL
jgi:hypothetical protein